VCGFCVGGIVGVHLSELHRPCNYAGTCNGLAAGWPSISLNQHLDDAL